ncbi:MAG: UDP-3-O-acyl-N-acetylglucosamine deacetylase [Cyanobacteria bacterium P01_F01_bin.150]
MGVSTSELASDSKFKGTEQSADIGKDALSKGSDITASPSLKQALQQTLSGNFTQKGVGLHSGESVQVWVRPAPVNTGRVFVRTDCPEAGSIPATVQFVQKTLLSTKLGKDNVSVRTVEHLLAALAAAGVDNAVIEINGPEVPLLDGSAQEWSEAIAHVGLHPQESSRTSISSVVKPLWCYEGDAFVAALPAPELRFSCGIDFPIPAIGNQWHSWSPTNESFEETIAPARTFTLAHLIEPLRQQGLIKGGSLENALVCDAQKGWVNPPLRFDNEPARHKLLDLVGDLSLIGAFPCAHILAYKASHALHTEFARRLIASYDNTQ